MRPLFLCAFLVTAACTEKKAPGAASPAPADANPHGLSPALPPMEKLQYEAQHRPTGVITAEATFAALEDAGFALVEKQQHMGAPFLAQYCAGAKGPAGTAFSVCEYKSEESATQGKKESETTLAAVPNRTLTRKARSVLTVREPEPKTAESTQVKDTAIKLFEGL